MAMLDTMTLAHLTTVRHLLESLESRGTVTLSEARQLISGAETAKRQQLGRDVGRPQARRSRGAGVVRHQSLKICPDCGRKMRYCLTNSAWFCRCGHSEMQGDRS